MSRVIINKRRLINSLFALACILAAPEAKAADPFDGYTPQVGEYFTTRIPTKFCWDARFTKCDIVGREVTFGVIGHTRNSVVVIVQFGNNFWKGWIPR